MRRVEGDSGGEGHLEIGGKEFVNVVVGTRDTLTELPSGRGRRCKVTRLDVVVGHVGGRGCEGGLHVVGI